MIVIYIKSKHYFFGTKSFTDWINETHEVCQIEQLNIEGFWVLDPKYIYCLDILVGQLVV